MLQLSRIQIKKTVCLFIAVIILNGCSVNYTITIDKDTINEKIEVLDNTSDTRTVTDIMDNYKKQYPVYSDNDFIEIDYDKDANSEYYSQTYNIDDNGYHLFYEYTYPIEKYKDANSLNISYTYKDITYKNNKLSISIGSTNNRMKYEDEFANLTVNIITDYVVTENNADSIIGNRYIWYINKNNNDEKLINFEVDLTKTQQEIKAEENRGEKKKNFLVPILVIALLLYIIIIFLIITKRKKNEA